MEKGLELWNKTLTMDYFSDNSETNREYFTSAQYEEPINAEYTEVIEETVEEVILKICINMALVDNNPTEKEFDYISREIASSGLDDETKSFLQKRIIDRTSLKINYEKLKEDDTRCIYLIKKLIEILKIEKRYSIGEMLYLKKVAQKIGLTTEDYQSFLDGNRD